MLAFTSVYFLQSSLFNELQPIQIKKSPQPERRAQPVKRDPVLFISASRPRNSVGVKSYSRSCHFPQYKTSLSPKNRIGGSEDWCSARRLLLGGHARISVISAPV